MNEHSQNHQQLNAKPYQAPRLLIYGAVRDLTTSGTGQAAESSGQPQNEPDRKQ